MKKRNLFAFAENEHYHVYNRGTEKRNIFPKTGDYDRFLALLYLCNCSQPVTTRFQGRTLEEAVQVTRQDTLVGIGAFCLMPNHYHLLLHEVKEGGISKFVQKFSTAYTMYFNKKYDRSGVLFQGKFKAKHADSDEYLQYLFAYIHLNPLELLVPKWKERGVKDKKKAQAYLRRYPYSSYPHYRGKKDQTNVLLSPEVFPEYFTKKGSFEAMIKDWLSYNDEYEGN